LRRHAGQALAAAHALGQLFAVELVQQRFVVEQIDLRRRAGLEKINDALGLGREIGKAGQAAGRSGPSNISRGRRLLRAMAPRPRAVLEKNDGA
jgi:protein-disulfide isomerase-like protein with CxxC motif